MWNREPVKTYKEEGETLDELIETVRSFNNITDRDRTLVMLIKILKGMGLEKMPSMDAYQLRNKLAYYKDATTTQAMSAVWKGHGYSCD